MNITQENKGNLAATLKIQLTKEDYNEKVEKALKDMQRKAQMPGFRPGKVPMGLVKKMYGKSVLADEVNKVLIDGIYDYIKENEINILGNPLPDHDKTAGIDWENQTDFEFHYDIGIAPVIDLELSDGISVEYYKIKIEDSMVEDTIKDITRRYGKMINPETSEKDDVLFGEFAELDGENNPIADGLKNKSNLFIQYIKDEETRNNLIGKKSGESVDLDIVKSVENESEMAGMLGIKKEELEQYGKNFRFTIERISRIEPAELNSDLFTKVAPETTISTEEDFREYMRNQLSKQYQADADKHFRNEAIKVIVEKANLELPEEFLKRWLLETNKDNDQITAEQVENEFVSFADSFKWQLIENHLIKSNNIEVKTEEVVAYLKDYMRIQLKQYGQENPDDEILNDFVNRIMTNKDEVKKVYDQLFDTKILELFKEKLKFEEKEVTFDEFVSIMTERYKSKESKS
jgi:trigger factor